MMARIFTDYAILQPFSQLGRERFDKDVNCTQFEGGKAAWNAIDSLLTGRGWQRTPPEAGTVQTLLFPLDRVGIRGASVTLVIKPGLTIGRVKARPEQTLGSLAFHNVALSDLPARLASEILRDIATLTR